MTRTQRKRSPRGTKSGPTATPAEAVGDLRRTEERYRVFVERDVLTLTNAAGKVFYASRSVKDVLGYDADEYLAANPWALIHPDDIGRLQERFAADTMAPSTPIEFRMRHKDGSWRILEGAARNRLDDPDVRAYVSTFRDVTGSREAERRQRASLAVAEAALSAPDLPSLFRALHAIIAGLMPVHNLYVALYDADLRMLRIPWFADEGTAAPPPRRMRKGPAEYVLRTTRALLLTPAVAQALERAGEIDADPDRPADWLGVPLWHGAKDRLIGVLVAEGAGAEQHFGDRERDLLAFVSTQVALAIERRSAEEDHARSTIRLRTIVEMEPECVKLVARDGTLLEMNPAGLSMIDAGAASAVIGRSIYPLVDERDRPAFRELNERAFAGGSGSLEFLVHTLAGRSRWLDTNVVPLRDDRGEIVAALSVTRDVTHRHEADEALRRSEQIFRSLVDRAPYGIYRSTLGGRFLTVNPALIAMLGYDTAAEVLALDIGHDVYAQSEERDRILAGLPPTGSYAVETAWKRRDGRVIQVRLTGASVPDEPGGPALLEVIAEDITERRALAHQLQQSQKMEAVGQLAGGIAHDFNNLITAITAYTFFMLEGLAPNDPRRADLEEIRRAADRGATLTQQLLAFSRKQVRHPRMVNLNDVVRSSEKLLRRLIGEDINIATALESSLGATFVDIAQMEQVLINLAVNARDAMPHGGVLTIATANAPGPPAGVAGPDAAAEEVVLTVSDTGEGMDAATRAMIFEPFFTTKAPGKGTGLGLSTVYGIVRQSGGRIGVTSAPGAGTSFTIHLPRTADTAEPPQAPVDTDRSLRGSETVLFVEDEPSLRVAGRRTLRGFGYQVLDAGHAEAAADIAAAHRGRIDLLVTDIVMPDMRGTELAARLAGSRPGMRVLYMSGYPDESILERGVPLEGVALLQKPFNPLDLARKVRETLGAGPVAA